MPSIGYIHECAVVFMQSVNLPPLFTLTELPTRLLRHDNLGSKKETRFPVKEVADIAINCNN